MILKIKMFDKDSSDFEVQKVKFIFYSSLADDQSTSNAILPQNDWFHRFGIAFELSQYLKV